MSASNYEIVQIDDRSWRFEENGVRAFLFTGTEKALLVDTGFGTGSIIDAVTELTSLPVMLVNTHTDRDHIGCNNQFSSVYIHPAEYDRYHQGDNVGKPVSPLWEGDVIDIGGRCFEVILIPGHTPGSIALLDAENRILVSGDSVQTGLVFMFGPGRNLPAYICSMEKLSTMAQRFDTVYPSHGPIPVDPAVLSGLIEGAKRLQAGELEGSAPPFDVEAKVYDAGVAKFLY